DRRPPAKLSRTQVRYSILVPSADDRDFSSSRLPLSHRREMPPAPQIVGGEGDRIARTLLQMLGSQSGNWRGRPMAGFESRLQPFFLRPIDTPRRGPTPSPTPSARPTLGSRSSSPLLSWEAMNVLNLATERRF